MKKAFTLIELIFVIVIIGVLAAVAVPKFGGLSDNAKISAEMATAASVQAAIDDAHSEWIISEGSFTWGANKTSDCSSGGVDNDFDCDAGYPDKLGTCPSDSFVYILKNSGQIDAKWVCDSSTNEYRGPASNGGVAAKDPDNAAKPDGNDYWDYNKSDGSFKLVNQD